MAESALRQLVQQQPWYQTQLQDSRSGIGLSDAAMARQDASGSYRPDIYQYGGDTMMGAFLPIKRRILEPEIQSKEFVGFSDAGVPQYNIIKTPAKLGPIERGPGIAQRVVGAASNMIGGIARDPAAALGGVSDAIQGQMRAASAGGQYFDESSGRLVEFDPSTAFIGGAPAGISAAARAAPGEVMLGSFGSAIKEYPELKAPKVVRGASKLYKATVGADALPGAPGQANIPGLGLVRIGASPEASRAAEQYSALSGIPHTPLTEYAPADPARGARIAREYELMQHAPKSPEVRRAYNQMIDETLGQYESMLSQGIKPYFIQGADPYAQSPYLALLDLEQNKRLGVFPTTSGFGSDASFDPRGNPLMAPTEFKIDGKPALANDIFRAVHDYYGHYKPGAGFRASGEETAFQSHAGMYSPLARRALTSETRGQNSWLNYGPYGDKNRVANIDETIFADQKTGLMPRWVTEEGSKTAADRSSRFLNAMRQNSTGLEGAINPDGTVSLIHYSHRPIERVDPAFYGTGLSGSTRSEMSRAASKNFVKPWFAGIETAHSAYKKERGLGPYKNEIKVPGELLYDVRNDPESLWRRGNPNKSEKNIADKNYSGYFYDHPDLGTVAVMFDPFDVSKKYVFPLAGVGAAAALAAGAESEQKSSQEGI